MFPTCHQCKMLFIDSLYKKGDHGEGLYWINPKISQLTDVRLDFCGPICSNAWYVDQLAVQEAIRHETDARTDPV